MKFPKWVTASAYIFGADFVALGDAVWSAPSPEIVVAEATRRIAQLAD